MPAVLVLVLATVAVYANTFRVPFVFDDVPSIVDNPSIRRLWPPGEALSPPPDWGFTVSGRPVLNFSLALNHAVSGLDVWSYHALNLAIHILAGLTLFGLVRRTLLRPPLAARFGEQAELLALVIAGVWLLHPLQAEAVTYVVQRAESLMGLFFLLTLYAFVRSTDSSRPRLWWVVAVSACLLGIGTKEVAALAPVMALLYDRTFVSGSFRAAWRRHRWLYLALAATWLPLALLLEGTGGNRGGTIGFDAGVSWSGYWLTQFEAVTRYLGLVFWPHPLVFDYGKITTPGMVAALPWALPVLALAAATLVALWRRPVPGFLGAWFFAILAPTSIVPGALQMIVEHRMYLPLAAVLALVFGALLAWLGPRVLLAVGAGAALAAGLVTVQRNAVYRSDQALWEDTVAKRPDNARAQNNLGLAYFNLGRTDEAIARYRESLRLDSSVVNPHYNLGLALMKSGRLPEAAAAFEDALHILPYHFNAHINLGIVLMKLGRPQEALAHFTEGIRFDPKPAEAHFQFGVALAGLGRWDEAVAHYAEALKIDPDYAEAQSNLGAALFQLGSASAAVEHFEAALRLKPGMPEVQFNLAVALASLGRDGEALPHYAEAVRLNPEQEGAQLNLGIALAKAGKLAEASLHLEQAVRLRPEDAAAHYNLGYALLLAGREAEARPQFAEAVRLRPDYTAARDLLRRLEETPPP